MFNHSALMSSLVMKKSVYKSFFRSDMILKYLLRINLVYIIAFALQNPRNCYSAPPSQPWILVGMQKNIDEQPCLM